MVPMTATVDSRPGNLNLRFYRGDDETVVFTFTGMNLTGYSFAAQIRDAAAGGSVVATFTDSLTDAANGVLTLTLGDADTALLPDVAFWDLEATTPGGDKQTWLAGTVTASGGVTS